MRKTSAVLTLILLAVVLSAIPSHGSAGTVGSSGVLVFPADSSSQSMDLGESATYRWILFNNGTSPCYINATVGSLPEGFSATLNQGKFILNPGNDALIEIAFKSPPETDLEDVLLTLSVEVSDIDTGAVDEDDFQVSIQLTGKTPEVSPFGKILGVYDNFLPDPLNNRWGAFLFTVLIWVAIGLLLMGIVLPIVGRRAEATENVVDDTIVSLVKGPIFAIIVIYGAFSSLGILGLEEDVMSILGTVYGVLVIILMTWVAYQVFRRVLIQYGKNLARKTKSTLDDRLVPVVDKIGAVVILIVGFIFIIQYFGYDITFFVAGLGVLGLIIAFAAQDTLSNFFSGIHIMLDRPFAVGERLVLESGEVCRVLDVGLRSTKLYDLSGHNIIVLPNNKVANMKILNQTRPDERTRARVDVGVECGADVRRVEEILLDIANSHPNVLKDKDSAPFVRLLEFGDSSLNFMLKCWVDNLGNKGKVESDIRKEINKRFAEEGIEIPFPQTVVRLHQGEPVRHQHNP
ncbi:MAG: mechanosensitive ion channel domain-containing protein [Thermoplasmata archaeon]